jgi:hypothetical protein
MNLQNISFPIELTIPEAELILAGLANLPKKDADPIFAKVQQTALAKIQEVQQNGASNPQVQDEINEAEANSDSMRNE